MAAICRTLPHMAGGRAPGLLPWPCGRRARAAPQLPLDGKLAQDSVARLSQELRVAGQG